MISNILLALYVSMVVAVAARVLLRDDMKPDTRMAWLIVLLLLPYAGVVLYYLLGEVNLGRHLTGRHQPVARFLQSRWPDDTAVRNALGEQGSVDSLIDTKWHGVFRYAASMNSFYPRPGCRAEVMSSNEETLERMLADMDSAEHEINVLAHLAG